MKGTRRVAAAIACTAIATVLSFGSAAIASTAHYSSTLPGYQGNVTIATGSKSSQTTKKAVTKPTKIKAGSAYQWLDDAKGRASGSKLTYPGDTTKLKYYNTTKREQINLRACTDGWKEPGIIKGSVNFG